MANGMKAPKFHQGNFECVSLARMILGLNLPKANMTSRAYSTKMRFEELNEMSRRYDEGERGHEIANARKQRRGICWASVGRNGRDEA